MSSNKCHTCSESYDSIHWDAACPRCECIKGQHPDLYEWVMDVVRRAVDEHERDYYHNRRPD